MSLPVSFLAKAEHHGCFSGRFDYYASVKVCLDPQHPVQPVLTVQCPDCLGFKVGVLKSLLPAGVDGYWLADKISDHNRKRRGFAWSLSGYHTAGPGFWLSAAYYDHCGVFLLNGSNSRSLGTDLDLLLLAFQQGVAPPMHPQMGDINQYVTVEAYVDFSTPIGPIWGIQDLLAAPQCRTRPYRGYQRVTVAEFLPVAQVATPPLKFSLPTGSDTDADFRDSLEIGDICPICNAEVRERPLFTGSYIGCLCQ